MFENTSVLFILSTKLLGPKVFVHCLQAGYQWDECGSDRSLQLCSQALQMLHSACYEEEGLPFVAPC